MEGDGSPLIGLIVFLILLFLDAVLYGFKTAVTNLSDSYVSKKAEEGNKKALWMQRMIENPYPVYHILQIMVTFISIIVGIHYVRMFGGPIINAFVQSNQPEWVSVICYLLITIVITLIIVSFGILAPQKLAIRNAQIWAFRLAGVVHGLVIIFRPFGFVTEKISNLVVRILGIDPNENVDDVTEEEIISMVLEGHEQGVLQANEAEMIHNIFQLDDKEAKDIMTHRKNIVAVDGDKTLAGALEYMLEKNNSRFPVYKDEIDNIIGVVHIKDTMILSREEAYLELPLCQVPNLVREVSLIPETRNISSLFQTMQSQKNHMAVVVDEYGQTAGLVTMEDILEEIVGNILDEYDEEDNMIMEQTDGCYLMKGMAPLEEVCDVLNLDEEEFEDYDTLNGYLISLIDKIPADNEVFELYDRGFLFQVLSVENKMIQTVRVSKQKASQEEVNLTCQEIQSVVE